MTDEREYLISCGNAGEFARFRAAAGLACRRGDRVVVRSQRGVELGTVRCAATAMHANLLDSSFVGELMRLASAEDETIFAGTRLRGQQLLDDGRRLAAELNLPLEILDVEVPLDGHQVTLFFLRWGPCDERPLVSALSRKYETLVALRDLGLPAGASACGKPDCGQGGCTSCGSGGCTTGGCSTGCGSKTAASEVREYFAGLRQKMAASQRTPLV